MNFKVPRTANLILFDSQLGKGPEKGRGPWTNLVQGAKRLDELQALAVGHAGWETATGDSIVRVFVPVDWRDGWRRTRCGESRSQSAHGSLTPPDAGR